MSFRAEPARSAGGVEESRSSGAEGPLYRDDRDSSTPRPPAAPLGMTRVSTAPLRGSASMRRHLSSPLLVRSHHDYTAAPPFLAWCSVHTTADTLPAGPASRGPAALASC